MLWDSKKGDEKKYVCLVCPVLKCVKEKSGTVSKIDLRLLTLREKQLRNKEWNGMEWVVK